MAKTKTGKKKTKPASTARDALTRATEELRRRGEPVLMPKWQDEE